MCPVGFVTITGFLDYFRGWLDFPFHSLLGDALIEFLFKLCVSLFLSPGLFPVCPRCCAVFAAHSLAASSLHQVQAADLRRVSAPPGSFTM